MKGKVLAIVAHVNINRIDAGREALVRQYNDGGERKETGKPRRRKKRIKSRGA